MSYRVPHRHLLVRPQEADSTTEGGLHVPVAAREEPPTGEVIMVPNGGVDAPVEAHVGDTVHYRQYSGVELRLLMPDTPATYRCEYCNARIDEPGLPELCAKRSDPNLGDFEEHAFVVQPPEPERLLVLDARDIILVEVAASVH